MAAAEHKAQNKAAANPLQSGAAALAGGFTQGFGTRFGNESAADLQTKQLKQALLILKEKEQIQQLKRQALSDKFLRHTLIEAGYDWPELRQGENNAIGSAEVSEKKQANTNVGAVRAILSGKGYEAQNRGLGNQVEYDGGELKVKSTKDLTSQERALKALEAGVPLQGLTLEQTQKLAGVHISAGADESLKAKAVGALEKGAPLAGMTMDETKKAAGVYLPDKETKITAADIKEAERGIPGILRNTPLPIEWSQAGRDVQALRKKMIEQRLGKQQPQQIQQVDNKIINRIAELRQNGWDDASIASALKDIGIDPAAYQLR